MRKLRLCFFVWRNLLLKKFNISNILGGGGGLPPPWNICQIINQHGGSDFPHSFIYFWKMCANPQIGFARIVESTTHRHACCWPTFNTGCLFGFVGLGGVRATSGVLFLKPQHHKKLQKRGALFSNTEISGKKEGFGSFHHGLQSWMVKE